jgi:hypothetical protein
VSVRAIKIESEGVQVPYRGSTTTATLDFEPDGIEVDGWGSAPTEKTVRNIYRALVDASAVDEVENTVEGHYHPRITSCEPVPETIRPQVGSRDVVQASRWIVTSHRPYTD